MDAEKLLQAFTPQETLELAAALPADVIQAEALRRGIELPVAAGAVAVEGTMQDAEAAVEEALLPDTKESLHEQLTSAYMGYLDVTRILNVGRKTKEQVEMADEETVASELEAWLSDEKLAYAAAVQEADPTVRFTLIATPNVTASAEEVITLNRTLGEGQPYPTDVWSDVIKQYTPEEISSTNPANGNSVQFKLVPTKFDPEMYGTVDFQKSKLTEQQADNPFLDDTSPLEDVTRLFTLRAQGNKLVGDGTFEATYHRNIKMMPKRIGGWLRVPRSFVRGRGQPIVGDADVDYDYGGRVSVG